eukprot:2589718-Alexandrium_andersonii.AAC.1
MICSSRLNQTPPPALAFLPLPFLSPTAFSPPLRGLAPGASTGPVPPEEPAALARSESGCAEAFWSATSFFRSARLP